MKKEFPRKDIDSYIDKMLKTTALSMIWASGAAFLLNFAWFFFDDFIKTLVQEIVILSAFSVSLFNYRYLVKKNSDLAIRLYIVYGLIFGIFVIWAAGDPFIFTGFFILSLSSLIAIFAMNTREAVWWWSGNFAAGIAGLLLRHYLNIWGSGFDTAGLFQQFIFNNLIYGTLIFFGYNIAAVMKKAMSDINNQNEELYKLSITDKLTGLNNRLKIDRVLAAECERASRYDEVFSVVLMDVDHFKRFNDQYGHQFGDEVLVKIAALLRENIRQSDFVGRWGGEEFMIICPGTGCDSAFVLAEKLRNNIKTEIGHDNFKITASFGIAQWRTGMDDDEIVKNADDALYKAKRRGRNRTVKFLS